MNQPTPPTHCLKRQMMIARPIEEVFWFFERPENLAEITPRWLDFTLLTPTPIPMHVGAVIDYTIRVAGLRVRWKTLITQYAPPYFFVDEQLRGPYDFWHHTHRFEPVGEETKMIDEVHYLLPYNHPAKVLNWLYVRPRLEQIFDFRAEKILKVFVNKGERA